jgi:hypothetical protein
VQNIVTVSGRRRWVREASCGGLRDLSEISIFGSLNLWEGRLDHRRVQDTSDVVMVPSGANSE